MDDELDFFPLTRFEIQLKKYYEMRPDIKEKILTPEELSEYISWLAQTYYKNSQKRTAFEDVNQFRSEVPLTELGILALTNPGDHTAMNTIFSNFEHQNEEVNFLSDHDISINQIYRFMPTHWHSNVYFQVYFAYSDYCEIHFTDEIIHMNPGTIVIIAPSVSHATPCYREDCVLMYSMLRASTFEKVFWNQLNTENIMSNFFHQALRNSQNTSYLQFESSNDSDLRLIFNRMSKEYMTTPVYSTQMINALMSEFFILLLRRYENTARLPHSVPFHWKHEFSSIFSYIQKNYASTSQAEVAEHFHYSERQINRIVTNCTGLSYAQLILRLRMEKAATMLKQRHSSMELIALTVGYSTLSSFFRAFTKYYHCTPGEYYSKETNQMQ